MKNKSRRQENADQTHAALVKDALYLFAKYGYANTSVDTISERARVTKGAFYHHFKNKKAIFEACYRKQAEELSLALKHGSRNIDSFQAPLILCETFLDFVLNKERKTIPIQEAITVLGWRDWHKLDTQFTQGLIQETLDNLKAENKIQDVDTSLLTGMMHSMMVDASMSLIQSDDKTKTKEEILRLISMMMESLKAD